MGEFFFTLMFAVGCCILATAVTTRDAQLEDFRKELVKSGHAEYVLENDKAVFRLKECK